MDTYEKKYIEALERAKSWARGEHPECFTEAQKAAEFIFPELAESEDEKTRKELIQFIKNWKDPNNIGRPHDFPTLTRNVEQCDRYIAWLEKQREEKHQSKPIKDYQGEFGCWNNAHDFRPKHLQRCLCYDKYMNGVYCYVYDDISKYWCTQTTEEHDPDGDNHISDYYDYRVTVWMPLQGVSFYPSKSMFEKQGEPIDKVEPKFKKGDWVIDKQGIVHQIANVIENVTCHTYGYDIVGGGYFNDNTEGVRLWTIEDAKDGDVLVHNGCTFIFKGIKDGIVQAIEENILEPVSFGKPDEDNDYHPATKEQRDQLEKAMTDAGYKWDAEKKELRKIENSPILSNSSNTGKQLTEEDERAIGIIKVALTHPYNMDGKYDREFAFNWLKSLKQRMEGSK